MKTCCQCKILKPLTDYHRNKNLRDGRAYICKECKLKYFHDDTNKEKMLKQSNDYHKNNPDKVKTYNRTAYLKKKAAKEKENANVSI